MGILGVGVVPQGEGVEVKLFILSEDLGINPEVWAEDGNRGRLKIEPFIVELSTEIPIHVCQYSISLEGKRDLSPVVENLIRNGLLELCTSPYSTPHLASKKVAGKKGEKMSGKPPNIPHDSPLGRMLDSWGETRWTRGKDRATMIPYCMYKWTKGPIRWEINKIVHVRHPVVPNPYTITSKIPPECEGFSVVDLKDAFWTCPLDKNSQDIFAFEWEDIDRQETTT
ncbi:hypothetical protein BTVI_105518 [Pitangus sulphuratus]|nr:hypothetical protein BTVI_105518 [Pitangus sulphuratus]